MRNPFAFLKFRIYRRTFYTYCVIMLLLIGSVSGAMLFNARAMGLAQFVSEADSDYSMLETKRQNVLSRIDRLFFRIYASRSLETDFSGFFGASPEEYMRSRLNSGEPDAETYLDALSSLVAETGCCIRYVLHDTGTAVTAAEFSANGYSRYHVLSAEAADGLSAGMLRYTRDVTLRGQESGTVTFLIDLTGFVEEIFHGGNDSAVCYYAGGREFCSGLPELPEGTWQGLLAAAPGNSSTRLLGQSRFFWSQSPQDKDYTLAVVAPRDPYLFPSLQVVILMILCVVGAFACITYLYGRQFTKDTRFLQKMLDSMDSVQESNFAPLDLEGRDDEFGQIASNLNSLYRHLELLIRQKYELTISQQRTEMNMLSAQLNPHFLYNTLEMIRLRAMREGAPHAAEAAASLGQLYRNIVKTEAIIPMGRELDITAQYLDLMGFLYGEQVLYHMDLDPALRDMPTPKIWMQPILENFFKHNFRDDEKIKVVVIQTRRRESGADIEFFDNLGSIAAEKLDELNQELTPSQIRKYAQTQDKGIGLKNVYLRLSLYYGERVSMEIRNNQPTGVRIRVQIRDEEGEKDVQALDRG